MGICDSTSGKCICRKNFHGEACQYMSCPDDNKCSGDKMFVIYHSNQYETALEEGEREDENHRERERERKRKREREITISIYSSSVFFFPIILISDPVTNISLLTYSTYCPVPDLFIYSFPFNCLTTCHLGHGRCADMKELASFATNNGDTAYYTYGADPNNKNTWDAER